MSNNSRRIAIVCWNKDTTLAQKMLNSNFLAGHAVKVYFKSDVEQFGLTNCDSETFPDEIDIPAKAKNYVIQREKAAGYEWLHIIEDTVVILKDPNQFICDLESMMTLLDINSWLSTITDSCNRVYFKYNPRLKIKLDRPEYEKFGLKELLFCSHSNTQWMTFNLVKGDENELHFNEDFKVAMFWIIEYLARRRNSHPESMYFMNQYATVQSELDIFENTLLNDSDKVEIPELMKEEDQKFKSLQINYSPDNNVDNVLERIYLKLESKI